jgi:hypothetical protein
MKAKATEPVKTQDHSRAAKMPEIGKMVAVIRIAMKKMNAPIKTVNT